MGDTPCTCGMWASNSAREHSPSCPRQDADHPATPPTGGLTVESLTHYRKVANTRGSVLLDAEQAAELLDAAAGYLRLREELSTLCRERSVAAGGDYVGCIAPKQITELLAAIATLVKED